MKIIFVSYFPGSCGTFIGSLCDVLLNISVFKKKMVNNLGESMRYDYITRPNSIDTLLLLLSNNKLLHEKYIELTCDVKYNQNKKIMFDKFLQELKFPPDNRYMIFSSHIICMDILEEKFPNQKKILIVPKNEEEMKLSFQLWEIKRSKYLQKIEYNSYYNFHNLSSLSTYTSPNLLNLTLSDILNPDCSIRIIDDIINHIGIENPNRKDAIKLFNLYLEKQPQIEIK